jgi:hypothetical protein
MKTLETIRRVFPLQQKFRGGGFMSGFIDRLAVYSRLYGKPFFLLIIIILFFAAAFETDIPGILPEQQDVQSCE